jgi:integrase
MAARSPIFKRCSCRVPHLHSDGTAVLDTHGKPVTKRAGASCPKLRRRGQWNPDHGTWHFQLQYTVEGGASVTLGQGGIDTLEHAEATVAAVRALVAVADETTTGPAHAAVLRAQIIERVRACLKARTALPEPSELRRAALTGERIKEVPTVGDFLTQWVATRHFNARNTYRSYESHIRLYLVPHLGRLPLDKLAVRHLRAAFTAIAEQADLIPAENSARRQVEQALRTARAADDPAAVRAAAAKLAAMPPYRRPVKAASIQRIRATLSAALSTACEEELLAANVARLIDLPSGRAPKPRIWTTERVERWRTTGQIPSPVMVWTIAQTNTFMQRAAGHDWHALYHLVSRTGLRRGEVAGLRWSDLDLEQGTMSIEQQIVQHGWTTDTTSPKTDAGDRIVALDPETRALLKEHRQAQKSAQKRAASAWIDTGLVFTESDGSPLHPALITGEFQRLAKEAGLPPIRLHDLRHGAATHALTAGVPLKVVSDMLGHSTTAITSDTYTSVVDEAKHTAAAKIAAIFTIAAPQTPAVTDADPEGDDIEDQPHQQAA